MAQKEEVEIRRAPKYRPFLLTGGAFGLFLALVLFFVSGQLGTKDALSVLGVLIVFMSAVGAFGGLYLAVIFDRVSRAKAKRTTATKLEE